MGQPNYIVVCILGIVLIVLIVAILSNKLSRQKSSNETEFSLEFFKIFKFHMKHKSNAYTGSEIPSAQSNSSISTTESSTSPEENPALPEMGPTSTK